jgi:hypothetical protein
VGRRVSKTYNLKLPDGTIVRGIPRSIDPEKYLANMPKDRGPESDSAIENFAAGLGRSFVNTGRNLANIALPERLAPEWATDEAINAANKRDEALLDTGAGFAGNLTGEVAQALVPAGAAAKSARLAKWASRNPKLAGLAGGTALGAGQGAVVAGPENRLEGASAGAVGGLVGGATAPLLSRTGKGVARLTKSAKEYMKSTGDYLPLSVAAEPGVFRTVYKDFLPNLLGGGAGTRGAMRTAESNFRQRQLGAASPYGTNVPIGDDVTSAVNKTQQAWETTFDEFKGYPINVDDFGNKYTGYSPGLTNLMKGTTKTFQNKFGLDVDSDTIPSDVLLEVRTELTEKLGNTTKTKDRSILLSQIDEIDATMVNNLPKKAAAAYQHAREAHPRFEDIQEAVRGVVQKSGEFTPQRLAKASAKNVGKRGGAAGQGATQYEAQLAARAFNEGIPDSSIWRTAATWGLTGGAAAFLGGLPALAIAPVATRGLTTKGFQNALAGRTDWQNWLRANPRARLAASMGAAGVGGQQVAAPLGRP